MAVALALRSSGVLVPLLPESALDILDDGGETVDSPAQVRVFRRGDADKYMLLLFSSPEAYAAMVPEESELPVANYDSAALLDFLKQNEGVLETVWFDVAGPHSMQALPADVIAALELK